MTHIYLKSAFAAFTLVIAFGAPKANAQTDGWQPVMTCEDGLGDKGAIIYNRLETNRLGYYEYAQIVVKSPSAVRYFSESAVSSSDLSPVNGDWVAAGLADHNGTHTFAPEGNKFYSFEFKADEDFTTSGSVVYDGQGVKLNAYDAHSGHSANWYFHPCTKVSQ